MSAGSMVGKQQWLFWWTTRQIMMSRLAFCVGQSPPQMLRCVKISGFYLSLRQTHFDKYLFGGCPYSCGTTYQNKFKLCLERFDESHNDLDKSQAIPCAFSHISDCVCVAICIVNALFWTSNFYFSSCVLVHLQLTKQACNKLILCAKNADMGHLHM